MVPVVDDDRLGWPPVAVALELGREDGEALPSPGDYAAVAGAVVAVGAATSVVAQPEVVGIVRVVLPS